MMTKTAIYDDMVASDENVRQDGNVDEYHTLYHMIWHDMIQYDMTCCVNMTFG